MNDKYQLALFLLLILSLFPLSPLTPPTPYTHSSSPFPLLLHSNLAKNEKGEVKFKPLAENKTFSKYYNEIQSGLI